MREPDLALRPVPLRLLSALLSGPKSPTELAARTGVTKAALYRYLRGLQDLGFVRQEGRGRATRYTVASGSLHLELRPEAGIAMHWLSPGPVDPEVPWASQIADPATRHEVLVALTGLRTAVQAISDVLWQDAFVVLFGSFARGQATWKSDVDILLVHEGAWADEQLDLLGEILPDINEQLDHRLELHMATGDDFLAQRKQIHKEAATDGIVLHAPLEGDRLWIPMTRYKNISL